MTADSTRVDLSAGFPAVDQSGDAGGLAAFLDRTSASDWTQAYKRASFKLMRLAPDARALDVGCGTGTDALALADLVGADGQVVGVDASAAMVDLARQRGAGRANLTFQVADTHALPFADATFDASRADRTLQHVADPAAAIAELTRVTRPGGWIVVSEPDSDIKVIDAPDRETTRVILRVIGDGARRGWIGRQLYRHFVGAGLVDVAIQVDPLFYFTLARMDDAFRLSEMAAKAVNVGWLTADRAQTWLQSLREADAAGQFFGASFIFTAAGRKPDRV